MIKSVYFGCRIVELSMCQEKELKQIYKEPLLIKLGLSRNFPQSILYSRKSALGIEIMTPNIIIAILKAKLYLGNMRVGSNTTKAVSVQEEYLKLEAGRDIDVGYDPSMRYWKSTWIDKVSNLFYKRNIIITNEKTQKRVSKNKSIMAYAIDYMQEKGLSETVLKQINFIRIKKEVYLPCELIGMNRKTIIGTYENAEKKSQIR